MMHENKRDNFSRPKSSLKAYIWIALSILIAYVFIAKLAPHRVGDGNEYYAMYLAWKETLRPWMNDTSYNAFQQLYLKNSISDMMPVDWLRNSFPALRLRDESDFNHFWLYSLLAFLVARASQLVGLMLSPHTAFLGLHFFLVTGTAFIAYRLYGKRGIITVALMTVFSPMLWFADKVHTELFTYCLTLSGVMLVYSRKYTLAAFLIALASTQNPSFALIAFIPFAFRFFLEKNKPFSITEVFLVVGTAFAVLAHPVYYFLRFGVPTPQLLAGGASFGENLPLFYIWLFDPDLGLIPNWPMGILLICLATCIALIKKKSTAPVPASNSNKYFYLFSSVFLVVSLFANSSTTNLNSGATPGLARYSLWYLPLLFPLVLYVITHFPTRKLIAYPLALVMVLLGYASIKTNDPRAPEGYLTPTWISNAIQVKLPWLYNPPEEVFKERFSGLNESGYDNVRAVLGPDCHKYLILPGKDLKIVTVPGQCMIDASHLARLINESPAPLKETFSTLTDAQYNQVTQKIAPGTYSLATSGNGTFALTSGWWSPEGWGVWSARKTATLSLPCNPEQYYGSKENLEMVLTIRGFGRQKITLSQNDHELFKGRIEAKTDIPLMLDLTKCTAGRTTLKIKVSEPRAPSDIMESQDRRELGIGIYSFTLKE